MGKKEEEEKLVKKIKEEKLLRKIIGLERIDI